MLKKCLYILLLISSCKLPEEKLEDEVADTNSDTTTIKTSNEYAAVKDDTLLQPLPVPKKIKKPSGIYRTTLPYDETSQMEQTIAFYNNYTFQLEEKYTINKKDSIVTTQGNWSPSDGYIWIYKEQVMRGRYIWKGDTLQYLSPRFKKKYSMHSIKDALENNVWRNKKKEGIVVFGIGNEPFWSIEVNNKDSVSFLLSEWPAPVTLKIDSLNNTPESIIYLAHKDSIQLKLTVFPLFCNDGMSDFMYRNKVKIQYNNQTYSGCGILYK